MDRAGSTKEPASQSGDGDGDSLAPSSEEAGAESVQAAFVWDGTGRGEGACREQEMNGAAARSTIALKAAR